MKYYYGYWKTNIRETTMEVYGNYGPQAWDMYKYVATNYAISAYTIKVMSLNPAHT